MKFATKDDFLRYLLRMIRERARKGDTAGVLTLCDEGLRVAEDNALLLQARDMALKAQGRES